jgi:Subtilase family
VTDAPRLLRGTLPCLLALALATGFVLPANAQSPDASRSAEWWLTALNASSAWRAAPGEGEGVVVAVLSTGVDATDPDLAGDVTVGRDFCDCGRTAAGPYWGYEGTAVASLLAGHGHGRRAGPGDAGPDGITGVAPAARILAIQVTLEYNDPQNSDSAMTGRLPGAIAAGIRYAVAQGASVIALPLDPGTLGQAASGDTAAAGGSTAERAAVSYALAHNVVLVAPAGDNGASTGTVNYPAAYPGVVAVGATEPGGQLAPFTSRRAYVTLTAPGAGLTVADPGGGYSTLASTDMSAALTAGVAALIRSQFPRLSATEVASALEAGSRPAGARPPAGNGHGRLDAAGSLTVAATIAAAHPAPARTAKAATPLAPAPSPRLTPHHAAVRAQSPSTIAVSVLRYALVAVLVLIAALAGTLALTAARRRQTQAARRAQEGARSGQGGSHARRPRGATRTHAAGQPAAARQLSRVPGSRGAGGPGSTGSAPRIVPASAAGALGMPGRRPRRRKQTEKPPWDPASLPAEELPGHPEYAALPPWAGQAPAAPRPLPRARPALPAAGGRGSGGQPPALAPWEESPEDFAAARMTADLPEWAVNSGPMYVWNPNATTSPQPAVAWDEDADLSPGGPAG